MYRLSRIVKVSADLCRGRGLFPAWRGWIVSKPECRREILLPGEIRGSSGVRTRGMRALSDRRRGLGLRCRVVFGNKSGVDC
ncbi:Alpha-ketoglutarate-dependent sulfonate dioxygenase [Colletotrichum scovillei]|uniref:Alpha-ketoglutarate-dependent sulfonate dioxygenase n=1 Tax=Colletotrichum scovillei TaxID=1209932 RepID=A0A9P7UCJ3_9PEZI|nr:Alpha-ketoglutarate-dependent sulfonate dioxygenase [Colletotrichum scovillei]KAG7043122.1 Alpha-ketoglutarate-dependent sulfonate dioxygenase [Colletotrichum scovillei]KAG7062570.1 Alpha-ketoglutarate-dependent sulfonate dioxygenase [Colletotrichum scovillei]